jgi:hypothetical protein
MTLKVFPHLTGDGRQTLDQLIGADPRARRLADLYRERHRERLDEVLAEGELFPLVFAGNHCQGTIFKDGSHLVTPELERRIDEISRSIPGFFFGRYDIRFTALEGFLRAEDLSIVEINGASAEATHIWDASATLLDAYATLFEQFRIVFTIGAANRRLGHRPLGVIRFVSDALSFRKLARSYPKTR